MSLGCQSSLKLFGMNGGDDGARTSDLCRDRGTEEVTFRLSRISLMRGIGQGGQISPLFHEGGQISPLFHEDGQDVH